MLSVAELKFLLHKGVIVDWTKEWDGWRNPLCGTEESTGSKGRTDILYCTSNQAEYSFLKTEDLCCQTLVLLYIWWLLEVQSI